MLPLKLNEDSTDNFLDMGKDWTNSEFGPRYVKYRKYGKNGGTDYIGEWSTETNKPHGRCILINSMGSIYIGYRNNGVFTGKYIMINNDGGF